MLASLACLSTPTVCFAAPPWTDDDPRRRELEQRLPPDHLARRLEQAVARLDLTPLYRRYAGTGSPPYRPDLLLCAVLFEVQRGQHSPADWHRHARECEPLRWLLRGCLPSRSRWYAFRDRVAPLLDDFQGQVLALAVTAGHTPATRTALDGTLVAANASRHRLLNQTKLQRRQQVLAAADTADSAADTTADPATVPAARPAWVAPTPAGRVRQQQALAQARQRLEQAQRHNGQKRTSKRQPADRVVVSVSDPEAAVGRDKEGVYRPLYNVQVADDLDSPLVLGYQVLAQPNDAGTLGPMLSRLRGLLGHPVQAVLADSAYAGGADLAAAAAAGAVVYAPAPPDGHTGKYLPKSVFVWQAEEQEYVCPQGQRLSYEHTTRQQRSGTQRLELQQYRCPPVHCQGCPLQKGCTPCPQKGRTISRSEHEGFSEALRARMGTVEGKTLYRQRSQSVELVNADWKTHRRLRRFSGRGLMRVRGQVGLVVLAHNLLTLLDLENKSQAKEVETASTSDVTPSQNTA